MGNVYHAHDVNIQNFVPVRWFQISERETEFSRPNSCAMYQMINPVKNNQGVFQSILHRRRICYINFDPGNFDTKLFA